MNKELNQKLNYLLLGDEKYTACPHISTISAEDDGIHMTDECGTDKVTVVSYEYILEKVLDHEVGKEILSEIVKQGIFENR